MSETAADSTGVYENNPTYASPVSTVVHVTTAVTSVPVNIFTGALQDIIGIANTQIWFLVNNGYDNQESVLYCKFKNIKEWCPLKAKITEILNAISSIDRNIKCLQEMALWLMDLALRGKITDLNNFKLLNLLMILRSAGLIFKTRDMEKEI